MDMQLFDYLKAERGAGARLALAVGLSQPFIWQCVSGARKLPPDRCPDIERATEAAVTCAELRPDIRWYRIADPCWPHPQGRPAIDVAAPTDEAKAA